MRIVLDTNVLVSALLNPNGKPASVLRLVLGREVVLCVDARIFSEYRHVLMRPRFGFRLAYVEALLAFIEYEAISVTPSPLDVAFPDTDDLPFYETALAAKARYLVTGNQVHYPKVEWIITPAVFVNTFLSDKQ